jgi:hypothetical protein
MNITEQKDRIFIGEIIIYNKDGSFRTEKFSGIIENCGEEYPIVEHDKGFSMGDILDPDEIEFISIEDDEEKSVLIASDHLYRVQV